MIEKMKETKEMELNLKELEQVNGSEVRCVAAAPKYAVGDLVDVKCLIFFSHRGRIAGIEVRSSLDENGNRCGKAVYLVDYGNGILFHVNEHLIRGKASA